MNRNIIGFLVLKKIIFVISSTYMTHYEQNMIKNTIKVCIKTFSYLKLYKRANERKYFDKI